MLYVADETSRTEGHLGTWWPEKEDAGAEAVRRLDFVSFLDHHLPAACPFYQMQFFFSIILLS